MSLVTQSTLRERQITALKRMLHFNNDILSPESELAWKVLILDSKSTKVVSSVLRVNDLLLQGITLHSMINTRRAQLDVPAVYFVQPTLENVGAIIQDIQNDQYSQYFINFTSSLPRSLLEEFAKKVALAGPEKSSKVKQVWDQYLDFIVSEPNLFSLDIPMVYASFNNPKSTEEQINFKVDEIANGLYSAVLTWCDGNIPIIRANRGGAAELISQKVDQKLRDYVINTKQNNSSLGVLNNNDRPVVLLLDRNINLQAMFSHSWIYQCMVSDVFHLERNTIKIDTIIGKDKNGDSIKESKRYDIEPKDFFWNSNASLPFPDAVEHVEAELSKYTEDANEITQKTGYSSISDIDPNNQADTKHIQEAIKALPDLTHRKSIIDMHMTVLSELIKELQSKSLDSFFEIEQNLSDKNIEQQFLELLESTAKGDNKMDKLRTYVILYLSCDLSASFIQKCESKLAELSCDLSPLIHIKKVKELTKMSQITGTSNLSSNSNNDSSENKSALFSSLSSKLLNLDNGRFTDGFGNLVSGLKKLLPASTHLPITNITQAIMTPSNANQEWLSMTDDYVYFDPSVVRGSHSKKAKRGEYSDGMVCMIGGGSVVEYCNLMEWMNSVNNTGTGMLSANNSSSLGDKGRSICYGATCLSSAEEFLKECSDL
ncbi:syntaxin-binding protein [Martiniozyma asiatica (nom. inval.)]|nr:syntaxin-binding protein [Martiniozyma asiatica]